MSADGGKGAPSGIFIKTVSVHIVESLEGCGLDFAVLDAEHAPFDHRDIDLMMIAGRAIGLPLYVRVRDHSPAGIQSALDAGASGVVVPHVDSSELARTVVRAARFVGGARGFSSGTRHARYGNVTMADAVAKGDKAKVIVQIEHPDAVRDAEAILSVAGIDGVLIGRADLALAMGYTRQGPEVLVAVEGLIRTLRSFEDKIVGVVVGGQAERAAFESMGANWFLIGTDQGLLREAVRRAVTREG